MSTTVAFLWACLIIGVGIAMLGLAELASQAVQPVSEAIIGEPMCIQPDGSVCPFLEAILEEN